MHMCVSGLCVSPYESPSDDLNAPIAAQAANLSHNERVLLKYARHTDRTAASAVLARSAAIFNRETLG
jgi:hypothetical protein